MKGLSKRQQQIIDFIESYIQKNRISPTYREIQNHFSFSSLGTVHQHLVALKGKGVISIEKGIRRSIALKNDSKKENDIKIPFIGHIVAGEPIKTFPKMQTLSVPAFLIHAPENTYILKAQGDSLIEEQIADGDLLFVEAKREANAGETIVAKINRHETIVKKYFPEGLYARLEGGNPHLQAMILRHENIEIQGIVVALMRTY